MLLNFRIDNATSYLDGAFLDLEAANISEHRGSLIQRNSVSALPVIAIYGSNGAGKSNLLHLMDMFVQYVRNSVDIRLNTQSAAQYPYYPFNYSKASRTEPLEYEMTFLIDGVEYLYTVVLQKLFVQEETLEFRKKPGSGEFLNFFSRCANEPIKISSNAEAEKKDILFCDSMLNPTDLLLTALGRRDEKKSANRFSKIYSWFGQFRSFFAHSKPSQLLLVTDKEYYGSDVALRLAKLADPQIRALNLSPVQGNSERYLLSSLHQNIDGSGVTPVPFAAESVGTQTLLQIGPELQYVLDHGGILLADELDSSAHPLLVAEIVRMFMDPEINTKGAQLICTLHSVTIMDRRILRRDNIWFVDKDNHGVSELYSLVDIIENGAKVRNDADYNKRYILGNYGAIPDFAK